MDDGFDTRKARAAQWFRALRDEIVAAFEGLEATQTQGPTAGRPPGNSRAQRSRARSQR